MELSNYSSRTAEVKAIIASFMADKEEPVERKEIAEYVLDHVTTDVSDCRGNQDNGFFWRNLSRKQGQIYQRYWKSKSDSF